MSARKHPDITYRRHRYRSREPEREELDSKQGTMWDWDRDEFNSVVNILNDLAKGQKLLMDLMGQLASHSLEGSHKKEASNG